jgi:hypothetical protein
MNPEAMRYCKLCDKNYYIGDCHYRITNPIPENWVEKGPLFWEYTGKIKRLPFNEGDTRPWVYIEYHNKPGSLYREGYWMFKQFPSGYIEKEHFKKELSTAVAAAQKFMAEINDGYKKKSKKNPIGCQYCNQLPVMKNPEKSSKDILKFIDLLDHVNSLIAERTRYGTRTVDSNFGSYVLEWSNGSAKWNVYGEWGDIPPRSSKVLDANYIAVSKQIPGATRENLEYLANNKYLSNLPLYGGSFERLHKPDYTGVELPPVIRFLRDHNLPVSPEVQKAIERKSAESNPKEKRVYVIVGHQLRMLKLGQDEEEIRVFFKSHPYAYQVEPPTKAKLYEWAEKKEGVKATDGCNVKWNGYCKHGKPSWLIFMGMVHPPYKTLKKA